MQFSSRHVKHVEACSFLVALLHDILKQPHERGKFLFPPSHPGGVTGCLAESAPQTVETQDHLLNATHKWYSHLKRSTPFCVLRKVVALECCANIQERFLYMAPIFITIFEGIFYISSPYEYVIVVSPKQVLEFCGRGDSLGAGALGTEP